VACYAIEASVGNSTFSDEAKGEDFWLENHIGDATGLPASDITPLLLEINCLFAEGEGEDPPLPVIKLFDFAVIQRTDPKYASCAF
jgi:hypothetical protein